MKSNCDINLSIQFNKTLVNIVFGSLFRIVFNTLFGLSTTYWMAIVTRGLLGLLCGILGPIKVTDCDDRYNPI